MHEGEGPVEIVGAGLIGTSIALACRRAGIDVLLSDTSAEHLRTASGLGAGRAKEPGDVPRLVVVAVPPDHLGAAIAAALDAAGEDTVVTDVGSVKAAPLAAVAGHPAVARYVGSHPMAGSERSGPLAASADLFTGRPRANCRHDGASASAVRRVAGRGEACGAVPVMLTPAEHDKAVARTSHVPHLLASLVAGTLAGAAPEHLALTGQGIRDVTRVAAGDPALYSQIIGGNSDAVAGLLREVRERLDLALEAVAAGDRPGLESLLAHGLAGTAGRCRRSPPCTSPSPTMPASWPACSPMWAPAASTSRTCGSTTTRAGRSVWSSSTSRRAARRSCWPRSNQEVG